MQGGRWDGAASYTLHLWLGSLALQFTVAGRRPSSSWRMRTGLQRGGGLMPLEDGRPPSRELDAEHRGPRAGLPCGLIRRPVELPTVERIQADLTSASPDELRRRAATGDEDALVELNRREVV